MDEGETFHIVTASCHRDNQLAPASAAGEALIGAERSDEDAVDGLTCPIKFSALDVGRNDDNQ